MSEDGPIRDLTYEEAEALLAEGDRVHTFRQSSVALIGADWDRADILEALRTRRVQEAGPMAVRMGHGLVLQDDRGLLFVATRQEGA